MVYKKNPLVSVIIPVYCRELFVWETLKNVYDNDYRPIELIVVNDGSTDRSLEVLQTFQQEFRNEEFDIKVLDQPNSGAPAARNLGYTHATGDFIQFLDSDDFISPKKFTTQIALMDDERADFGLCDFEMVYTGNNKRIYHSNAEKIKKVLRTHGSFGCGSPLLRRELADKISWNTKLKRNQDVDYFQKAALLATNIAYTAVPLYVYVRHENERISQSYSRTKPVYDLRIQSLIEIWKYNKNRFYLSLAIVNLFLSLFRFKIRGSQSYVD